VSGFNRKDNMNKLILSLFCAAICYLPSSAGLGKYDLYLSYSDQLQFRVGINYEYYGIYLRPIFNKQSQYNYDSENDQYLSYSLDQRGVESGINLNKKLFSYKKSEMIINISSGFIVSHVNRDDNLNYWQKAGSIAIVPEIRMFKKASLTLTPLYYRYNFPIKTIHKGGNGTLNYLDMRLMQMSMGFKFYY
jgi:hypothetical protein